MNDTEQRLTLYYKIKAKTIQNFPKIIIEPNPGEIVGMIKQNDKSCRSIISETYGLIIFDSSQYTHASVTQVLENEYGIDLPSKLDPSHQLTLVSTKALNFERIFIFTSQRAYKNPLTELKKYSKVWPNIRKALTPVYVDYDKYDDVRYLLDTVEDKNSLLKELREVIDLT